VTRLSPRAIGWTALRREYALTAREVDTARLLYGGLRTSDIARELGVSVHTARHHIERLYMKLGVHTRGEAQRLIREF
jgi:DNA-binding CsgD family transcriptional regulator